MKKLYPSIGILFVLILTILLLKHENKSHYVSSKQLTKSSKEILIAELKNKSYRRDTGYFKQDKPDKFLEYLYLLKTGGDKELEYPNNYALNELQLAKGRNSLLKSSHSKLDWVQRGPGNVGGRTRGLIVDPDDVSGNTWFTGSVGGGIWKTIDAGENWMAISEDWPNLSVSTIVISQSNLNVIYAGTGEGFGNVDAIAGNGIFKSIDKGDSWEHLLTTTDNVNFKYINRLVCHPEDENILFAATNTGIHRTLDGGQSWEMVYQLISGGYYNRVQDMRMHPTNSYELIASVNDKGIVRSIDGGNSWKLIKPISEGRIELAYSLNFPDTLFALTAQSNLFMSIDGGDNWSNTVASGTKVEWLSGQGWYDNTLAAHPIDSKKLYVGGIDMHMVSIGGSVSEAGDLVYDVKSNLHEYIAFGDLSGSYLNGGVKFQETNASEIESLSVVFGKGKSQNAVRYTVGNNSSVTVPDAEYVYQDVVSVPFEVWDTKNNKQLVISFRDQNKDGKFSLETNSIEQFFIHALDYDSQTAPAELTTNGGVNHKRAISLYPILAKGAVWDENAIPELTLELLRYELKNHNISSLQQTVWNNYEVPNHVHADHHNIVIVENAGSPFRIVNCNDGGIAYSDDGGIVWKSQNKGYVTTQFYGISKHPQENRYLGGTQDNGTWLSPKDPNALSEWNRRIGGDGFETVWHPIDGNKLVASLYYNRIFISEDAGINWTEVSAIGDSDNESAPFITRVTNSISNPDLLLVGGQSGIWKSNDFGKNWSKTSVPGASWSAGKGNPQMEVSPVNSRYIWAGSTISSSGTLALSSDGGESFVTVNSPSFNYTGYISNIVAHPTDEKTAYLLFSTNSKPKVYVTNDLGQSWTELSGFGNSDKSSNGFPNVAVYDLLVMPHKTDVIWAATEIGIFESLDGGETWNYADNGLPAVCIWDMKIVGQQVIVGTHGRGIWTVDIPEIPVSVMPPFISAGGISPNKNLALEIYYPQAFDSVQVYVDDAFVYTKRNVDAGTFSESFTINSSNSNFKVQSIGYLEGNSKFSNYRTVESYAIELPVEKYLNSFSIRKDEFIGNGFSVSKQLFGDWAIHSPHPYVEARDYTYVLKYPIIVLEDEDKATLSYRDIALVEPGDEGTEFGDEKFWDYVTVEGTKDGINWIPLTEGYDVNYSSRWRSFANGDLTKVPNAKTLFMQHSLNLHEAFMPQDTILVRFRLFSDAASTGWGWIIDDLIIQDQGTGILERSKANGEFSVSPNPAQDFIKLKLDTDEIGELQVTIYNMAGKVELIRNYQKTNSEWIETVDINALDKGMKLVSITVGKESYSNKIIKK